MIEIDNISKYYGSISALSGVSFKIDKGTVFGLLGPNGAGKTTTLDIISGVLRPDTGRVVVDGLSTTTDLPEIQVTLATYLKIILYMMTLWFMKCLNLHVV